MENGLNALKTQWKFDFGTLTVGKQFYTTLENVKFSLLIVYATTNRTRLKILSLKFSFCDHGPLSLFLNIIFISLEFEVYYDVGVRGPEHAYTVCRTP